MNGAASESTQCIYYHTTSQEMEGYLNALPLVVSRGRATVQRVGDGWYRYYFGYKLRIQIDAPLFEHYHSGGLQLGVTCVGEMACGCASTQVPMTLGNQYIHYY